MKELKNEVRITGKLVKNNLDEFTDKNGNDCIGGSLILRTADKSEHEIHFFAYKYKKDENKNFTSEESYFYKQYIDAKENLKDMEHCANGEQPDVLSISDGVFTVNDFKTPDGKVVSNNRIQAKFINRVEPKDYDTTVLEARFEVEGIIEDISDEIVKNVPTGDLSIKMNAIRQTANGFGKDAKYEVDSLIPIKMNVSKDMATAFKSAGYYNGCFTKLAGIIVNTVDEQEVVEQVAFGEDIKKIMKTYVRKNEIKSGTIPTSIFEHELTQDIIETLKAKRKAKLAEVANGKSASGNTNAFAKNTSEPAPNMNYNPFAQ